MLAGPRRRRETPTEMKWTDCGTGGDVFALHEGKKKETFSFFAARRPAAALDEERWRANVDV